jgi:hypothetical protein
MCATKTCSSALTAPIPTFTRGNRFMFMAAMVTIAEAFQEAFAMRRTAQRYHLLNDE